MKAPLILSLVALALGIVGSTLAIVAACAPVGPPPPAPKVPDTRPVEWHGREDSDKVPVQIITLANGQAWFVVGTDTADWSPLVWSYDPETKQWTRRHTSWLR